MTAVQRLGLSTIVKATSTAITLVTEATPPGRKRARIEKTTLTDTLATDDMGIELQSDFEFTLFWDPNVTDGVDIDTAFGSKTVLVWSITFTGGAIATFSGPIVELSPEAIKKDNHVMRKVVVHRTTSIVYS